MNIRKTQDSKEERLDNRNFRAEQKKFNITKETIHQEVEKQERNF